MSLARRPESAVCRLPGARYPGEQQCRTAVSRLPRARPGENARRRHRQHGCGGRAGPKGHRSDDREKIRPHRQYHFGSVKYCCSVSICRPARAPASRPFLPASRVPSPHPMSPSISCCREYSIPTASARMWYRPRRSGAPATTRRWRQTSSWSRHRGLARPMSLAPLAPSSARRRLAISRGRFLIDGGRFPGAF